MTSKVWGDLEFWNTGEWQVIEERLNDYDKAGTLYCPKRENLFKALDLVPFEKVRVMIVGQDPYPNPSMATGLAFDIPEKEENFPVTLQNIFREYSSDLHYDTPQKGSLKPWAAQGVLLWNAIPTCLKGQPLAHESWVEWSPLTVEIIRQLNQRHIVFVFLGRVARTYVKYVDNNNEVIETSHPSPRGQLNSTSPFIGSRIFSKINEKLNDQGIEAIEWRLP